MYGAKWLIASLNCGCGLRLGTPGHRAQDQHQHNDLLNTTEGGAVGHNAADRGGKVG